VGIDRSICSVGECWCGDRPVFCVRWGSVNVIFDRSVSVWILILPPLLLQEESKLSPSQTCRSVVTIGLNI
jgi:hypothetical protein